MDSKSNATQGPPKATQGPAKARQRERKHSAVTSGRRLFAIDGDPLSPWSRRYRDLLAGHVSDLGGRDASLSESQLSLIRRVSTVEVELEAMEARLSRGEDVDLDLYGRLLGHLRRAVETLHSTSLKRHVKEPTALDNWLAVEARAEAKRAERKAAREAAEVEATSTSSAPEQLTGDAPNGEVQS
jgi:hypothetical protein